MSKIAILKDNYFFNFDNNWLYKDNEKIIQITGRESDLLRCLCEAPNQYLSFDKISEMIEEMDFEREKGTRVNNGEFLFFSRETIKPWKSNLLKKHEVFRDKSVISSERGRGYIYYGQPIRNIIIGADKLPHELTETTFISASGQSVLFRDFECNQIIESLKENRGIVLSGMGGSGKTSIARLVYSVVKNEYDCCGWINYNGNLMQCMLAALRLDDFFDEKMADGDIKKKWKQVLKIFANNKQSKLFVIDNVDYIEGIQSPSMDTELAAISGWDNIKVIITSRLPKISGYDNTIKVNNLGDQTNCDKCIELFYHYNPEAAEYRDVNYETVKKLCELAGYNTMVIELVAKDSRYDYQTLDEYYFRLVRAGFKYADEVPIETDHDYKLLEMRNEDGTVNHHYYDRGNETAASQLVKLFNTRSRSIVEQQILWDFHCLPEAERVSREELRNWLGYSIKEINSLKEEGWIKYENGFFNMHPLINQAISCTEEKWEEYWKTGEERRRNEKIPSIISMLKKHLWFEQKDGFTESVRKIRFADYLSYEGRFLIPEDLLYIADYARKRGVRDVGQKYYKICYDKLYDRMIEAGWLSEKKQPDEVSTEVLAMAKQFWKCTYFYGYMLSYTRSGLDEAETYLALSSKVIQQIGEYLPEEERYKFEGMSLDHYGYVKSNNNKNQLNIVVNACMLYRLAILYRKRLTELYPENLSYYKDLAWSLDNLGTLFAVADRANLTGEKGTNKDLVLSDKNFQCSYEDEYSFFMNSENKAEGYLQAALEMRRKVAAEKGDKNSTEVAWTCCNIASLLIHYPERYEDAEKLLCEALTIYEELNKEYPGQHAASSARTYTTYGRLLAKWKGRRKEAQEAYKKSIEINSALEHDYPGVYIRELEEVMKEAAAIAE